MEYTYLLNQMMAQAFLWVALQWQHYFVTRSKIPIVPGHYGLHFLIQIYFSPYSQTWCIYFPQPSLKVHLNQLFPLAIRPSPSLYNSISPAFFHFPHLIGVKRGITQSHTAGRNIPRVFYIFYSLLSVFFLYILQSSF